MSARRVLVTGGTGFVGANLVRRLLHDGHRVHLLVRREHAAWRLEGIRDDVELHEVSLGDLSALTALASNVRPEWVFHLAASGAYSWQQDLDRMVATNVAGTMNLVRACLGPGFDAFVNTGSSSEYGYKDHAPHEREWLEPNSHYAVTKAAATTFCRLTAQQKDVHVPTLRLYSVFGPWEEPNRLVPTLIVRGLEGTLPPLVDPDVARDYVFTDDVCDAYLRAATTPGQERGAVYNVGSGVQTTLREIVEAARTVIGIAAEPAWGSMPNRRWDTSVWVSDPRAIASALGWKATTSVEEGLRRTVAWMKERPERREWYASASAAGPPGQRA
jgi:dolichol-phosphate mannosyltransferase